MKKWIPAAFLCLLVSVCLLSAAENMAETRTDGIYADRDGDFLSVRDGQAPSAPNTAFVPNAETAPTDDDLLTCILAAFLYRAAGDEPYVRQITLAAVVLNRMAHPAYPDTVTAVISQLQLQDPVLCFDFSVSADTDAFAAEGAGRRERTLYDRCLCAARLARMGLDPTGGSTDWQPRAE